MAENRWVYISCTSLHTISCKIGLHMRVTHIVQLLEVMQRSAEGSHVASFMVSSVRTAAKQRL